MSLVSFNPDDDYSVKGNSKAGVSIRQGNTVVMIPPELVEKIKETA